MGLRFYSRVLRRGAQAIGGVVLVSGCLLLVQYLSGNFHVVAAGAFYRAGQLSAGSIGYYTKRYGIRTIVNLRGPNPGQAWYDTEVAEAKKLGVNHIDFAISAHKELTTAQVDRLLDIFRTAQKPILVHCEGGADRSGLASSLYIGAIEKGTEFDAELQLSPLFGHFGIPYLTKVYAMDETWEKMEPALGFTGS